MALTITDLSKTYPNGVRALKNLSLTIGNNMFGLVGPNGAGKSSLMRYSGIIRVHSVGATSLNPFTYSRTVFMCEPIAFVAVPVLSVKRCF
jgi:ABC-type multidrug transport system ATPase subunit